MSKTAASVTEARRSSESLVEILLTIPPQRRGAALHAALVGHRADAEVSADAKSIRKAFDDYWVALRHCKSPLGATAKFLAPPMPVKTVMAFSRLAFARGKDDMDAELQELVRLMETTAAGC